MQKEKKLSRGLANLRPELQLLDRETEEGGDKKKKSLRKMIIATGESWRGQKTTKRALVVIEKGKRKIQERKKEKKKRMLMGSQNSEVYFQKRGVKSVPQEILAPKAEDWKRQKGKKRVWRVTNCWRKNHPNPKNPPPHPKIQKKTNHLCGRGRAIGAK